MLFWGTVAGLIVMLLWTLWDDRQSQQARIEQLEYERRRDQEERRKDREERERGRREREMEREAHRREREQLRVLLNLPNAFEQRLRTRQAERQNTAPNPPQTPLLVEVVNSNDQAQLDAQLNGGSVLDFVDRALGRTDTVSSRRMNIQDPLTGEQLAVDIGSTDVSSGDSYFSDTSSLAGNINLVELQPAMTPSPTLTVHDVGSPASVSSSSGQSLALIKYTPPLPLLSLPPAPVRSSSLALVKYIPPLPLLPSPPASARSSLPESIETLVRANDDTAQRVQADGSSSPSLSSLDDSASASVQSKTDHAPSITEPTANTSTPNGKGRETPLPKDVITPQGVQEDRSGSPSPLSSPAASISDTSTSPHIFPLGGKGKTPMPKDINTNQRPQDNGRSSSPLSSPAASATDKSTSPHIGALNGEDIVTPLLKDGVTGQRVTGQRVQDDDASSPSSLSSPAALTADKSAAPHTSPSNGNGIATSSPKDIITDQRPQSDGHSPSSLPSPAVPIPHKSATPYTSPSNGKGIATPSPKDVITDDDSSVSSLSSGDALIQPKPVAHRGDSGGTTTSSNINNGASNGELSDTDPGATARRQYGGGSKPVGTSPKSPKKPFKPNAEAATFVPKKSSPPADVSNEAKITTPSVPAVVGNTSKPTPSNGRTSPPARGFFTNPSSKNDSPAALPNKSDRNGSSKDISRHSDIAAAKEPVQAMGNKSSKPRLPDWLEKMPYVAGAAIRNQYGGIAPDSVFARTGQAGEVEAAFTDDSEGGGPVQTDAPRNFFLPTTSQPDVNQGENSSPAPSVPKSAPSSPKPQDLGGSKSATPSGQGKLGPSNEASKPMPAGPLNPPNNKGGQNPVHRKFFTNFPASNNNDGGKKPTTDNEATPTTRPASPKLGGLGDSQWAKPSGNVKARKDPEAKPTSNNDGGQSPSRRTIFIGSGPGAKTPSNGASTPTPRPLSPKLGGLGDSQWAKPSGGAKAQKDPEPKSTSNNGGIQSQPRRTFFTGFETPTNYPNAKAPSNGASTPTPRPLSPKHGGLGDSKWAKPSGDAHAQKDPEPKAPSNNGATQAQPRRNFFINNSVAANTHPNTKAPSNGAPAPTPTPRSSSPKLGGLGDSRWADPSNKPKPDEGTEKPWAQPRLPEKKRNNNGGRRNYNQRKW